MIPPLDPFAQTFDSIEIDPSRMPSQAAIESAMAYLAPHHELLTASAAAPDFAAPGFYLLDDAGGRFLIDRDMGVISLADEALLQSERGAVHGVRLRVVEQSGTAYELAMQLRLTGRVPQMVGAEEFAALAGLTDETVLVATRVPALTLPAPEAPPQVGWTLFAAAQAHATRAPRMQTRRGFIAPELPESTPHYVSLGFVGAPGVFAAHLPWSL